MQHYNNRESVLAAVQQNGLALRDAAIPLKGDRDIVLAAVQQDGAALAKRVKIEKAGVEGENREVGDLEDTVNCVVCFDAPRAVVLKPCAHFCLCQTCANDPRTLADGCPMCKSAVESTMVVVVS